MKTKTKIIDYLLSKSHLLMAFLYGGLLAIIPINLNVIVLGMWMSAFTILDFEHYLIISKPAKRRLTLN